MALAEIKSGLAQSSPAPQKSKAAFRTIAEVASALQVEAHVLRFWESKFSNIKPTKLRGGRRYYRPEDIEVIKTIKELLYDRGYTIRGVQKILSKKGAWNEMQSGLAADIAAQGVMAQNSGTAIAAVHITEPQIPVAANAPVAPTGYTESELAEKIRAAIDQNTRELQQAHSAEIAELRAQIETSAAALQKADALTESLKSEHAAQITQLQNQIQDLQTQLQNAATIDQALRLELATKIEAAQTQIHDLQDRLQQSQAKVQSLQQAIQATIDEWQQSRDLFKRP